MNVLELSVSTCLGFLSALLVEYLVKKYEARIMYKSILKGVAKELEKIKKRLVELKRDSFYVNPLDISYWKSILHSDNMNCLMEYPLYADIVATYQYIANVNHWENLRSNAFFTNKSRNEILDEALEKQQAKLCEEVEQLLDKMQEVL